MRLIFDIDGTLADASHRDHYAKEDKWDKFFDPKIVKEDKPIEAAQQILPKMLALAEEIYFITGRPESLRKTTENWLEDYFGIRPAKSKLKMRENGDKRKSSVVKREILEKNFEKDEGLIFIDDEEENLKVMDEWGLAVKAPDVWEAFF